MTNKTLLDVVACPGCGHPHVGGVNTNGIRTLDDVPCRECGVPFVVEAKYGKKPTVKRKPGRGLL